MVVPLFLFESILNEQKKSSILDFICEKPSFSGFFIGSKPTPLSNTIIINSFLCAEISTFIISAFACLITLVINSLVVDKNTCLKIFVSDIINLLFWKNIY